MIVGRPVFLWLIHFQYIGIPGLHPAIKDNGWNESDMKSADGCGCAMDVGGRLESGKEGPKKFLHRAGRLVGIIHENDYRPVRQASEVRSHQPVPDSPDSRSLGQQGCQAERHWTCAIWRESAGKWPGQFPEFLLSEAEKHGLGSLVDRWSGIIEGILGDVGEDKKISVPLHPLQDMGPDSAEIGDVDITIGDHQKFGERQLPFTEDPEAAGKGLAGVAIGDPGGGQTVKAGFTEGLQLPLPPS